MSALLRATFYSWPHVMFLVLLKIILVMLEMHVYCMLLWYWWFTWVGTIYAICWHMGAHLQDIYLMLIGYLYTYVYNYGHWYGYTCIWNHRTHITDTKLISSEAVFGYSGYVCLWQTQFFWHTTVSSFLLQTQPLISSWRFLARQSLFKETCINSLCVLTQLSAAPTSEILSCNSVWFLCSFLFLMWLLKQMICPITWPFSIQLYSYLCGTRPFIFRGFCITLISCGTWSGSVCNVHIILQ